MGSFTKGLSARGAHTKIVKGYCLICGGLGRFSPDHVPPKCCVTITKTEQRHITESLDLQDRSIKGVASPNGSKFKTICQSCNNLLGRTDGEVGEAYRELTQQIIAYFSSGLQHWHYASVGINPVNYARSMIGHLLAAASIKECLGEPVDSPYFTPLQNFVLGDDSAIENTHDIYYWFYPNNVHINAKLVAFFNEGHLASVSLLSFFPVAFIVTKKNEGTYPAQARKLSFKDSSLVLNLSTQNVHFATFSFVSLSGNSMFALSDQQAIISYPIGQ